MPEPGDVEGYKLFLEMDVVEAARQRVRDFFDLFDNVSCMCSGGKDSLAALTIVREEAERRGALPVNAVFIDEELLPDSVIDFVDDLRRQPWINLRWLAIPLKKSMYVLGKTLDFDSWDPNREWVRPKPPWAITEFRRPGAVRMQEMDAWVYEACGFRGSLVSVTGLRAAESMTRYNATMMQVIHPHFVSTRHPAVKIGKPIYDWHENDVLKFLHDEGVPLCPVYDAQHVAGDVFGWHFDTNALTTVLYLSDVLPNDDGDGAMEYQVFAGESPVSPIKRYWPAAGDLLVFHGREVWHRVAPLKKPLPMPRVCAVMNYYYPGDIGRPSGFDDVILGPSAGGDLDSPHHAGRCVQ